MCISWFLGFFIKGKYSLVIAFQEASQTDAILHLGNGQGETSKTKPSSMCSGDLGGIKERLAGFCFLKEEKEMLKLLFHLALTPADCQEKHSPVVYFSS